MNAIYEPKGKAREYSPLALNLYLQCSHGCKYCYGSSIMRKSKKDYFIIPNPRKNVLENLKKDLSRNIIKEQVMLSFIGDVYSVTSDNNRTTRRALEMLNSYHVPVAILTKGGNRCLKDLDIFKAFGEHIQVGTTLTFLDESKSLEWEPGAAKPEERLSVLKKIHDEGIKTFVSFEPVINPEESIKLIERTLKDNSVDVYKIGKINNYNGFDKMINWNYFLENALKLLRGARKNVYIKRDLRMAANKISLYKSEIDQDAYNVK